jgi:hypothetical protein
MPPMSALEVVGVVLGIAAAVLAIARFVLPKLRTLFRATVVRRRILERALALLAGDAAIESVIAVLGQPARTSIEGDVTRYTFADSLFFICVLASSASGAILEYSVTTRHPRFSPIVHVPWRAVRLGRDTFGGGQQGEVIAVYGASVRRFGLGYTEVYQCYGATRYRHTALSFGEGGAAAKRELRNLKLISDRYGLFDSTDSLTLQDDPDELKRYLADDAVREFRNNLSANTYSSGDPSRRIEPRDITRSLGPGQHLPVDLRPKPLPAYVRLGLLVDSLFVQTVNATRHVWSVARHPVISTKAGLRRAAPDLYLRLWKWRHRQGAPSA